MENSRKSRSASMAPVANSHQVKTLTRKDHCSGAGVQSKSPQTSVPLPKNYLSWYVPLKPKPSEGKISHIPQIKWKCPPKVALNADWRIAAGEESQEAENQKYREKAVQEVVYRDLNAIPPNPSTSSHVGGECCDEQTPIIPMIPIEEVAAEMPLPSVSQDQPTHDIFLRGLENTNTEVAVVMENNKQIDPELLIRLLNDPEKVKKLMDAYWSSTVENRTPSAQELHRPVCSEPTQPRPRGLAQSDIRQAARQQQVRHLMPSVDRPDEETMDRLVKKYLVSDMSVAPLRVKQVRPVMPAIDRPDEETMNRLVNKYLACDTSVVPLNSMAKKEEIKKMILEYGAHNARPSPSTPLVVPPRIPSGNFQFPLSPPVATPAPNKDFNYYKSQIMQHGEKHEPLKTGQPTRLQSGHNNRTPIVRNHKIRRPCKYFGTATGCRNGENCWYLHVVSSERVTSERVTGATEKRMKLIDPKRKL